MNENWPYFILLLHFCLRHEKMQRILQRYDKDCLCRFSVFSHVRDEKAKLRHGVNQPPYNYSLIAKIESIVISLDQRNYFHLYTSYVLLDFRIRIYFFSLKRNTQWNLFIFVAGITSTTPIPTAQPFSCPPDDTIFRTVQLSDGELFTYK
jgi:hypothetical protein